MQLFSTFSIFFTFQGPAPKLQVPKEEEEEEKKDEDTKAAVESPTEKKPEPQKRYSINVYKTLVYRYM